jgi:hypothetical protein
VSCKIILNELNDVLFIPVEAVFKEGGKEYVYIKSGSGFKRKEIVPGTSSTDYVVVMEGLEENEEVALTDPFINQQEDKGLNPVAVNAK